MLSLKKLFGKRAFLRRAFCQRKKERGHKSNSCKIELSLIKYASICLKSRIRETQNHSAFADSSTNDRRRKNVMFDNFNIFDVLTLLSRLTHSTVLTFWTLLTFFHRYDICDICDHLKKIICLTF